jgi:hypothetical protein
MQPEDLSNFSHLQLQGAAPHDIALVFPAELTQWYNAKRQLLCYRQVARLFSLLPHNAQMWNCSYIRHWNSEGEVCCRKINSSLLLSLHFADLCFYRHRVHRCLRMGRERGLLHTENGRDRELYVCITRTKLQTELLRKIYIISNVLSGCSQSHIHTHTKHDLYKDLLRLLTNRGHEEH